MSWRYLGYRVTLLEAAAVVGGMLYQGIPTYRLPREVIRAEVDRLVRMGVEIQTGRRLGRDFSVNDLLGAGYAAVFLGFGATRGRELAIPGAELDGIVNGVDFLLNANLGYHVDLGTSVVVVGGGNVAIDVARTALRYGTSDAAHDVPPGAETLLQSWGYDIALIDAARTALRLGARQVTVACLCPAVRCFRRRGCSRTTRQRSWSIKSRPKSAGLSLVRRSMGRATTGLSSATAGPGSRVAVFTPSRIRKFGCPAPGACGIGAKSCSRSGGSATGSDGSLPGKGF